MSVPSFMVSGHSVCKLIIPTWSILVKSWHLTCLENGCGKKRGCCDFAGKSLCWSKGDLLIWPIKINHNRKDETTSDSKQHKLHISAKQAQLMLCYMHVGSCTTSVICQYSKQSDGYWFPHPPNPSIMLYIDAQFSYYFCILFLMRLSGPS